MGYGNTYECGTCFKVFPAGWSALNNHIRATGHRHAAAFECDRCTRRFGSERARFQHMEATNHFEWECSLCNETWPTEDRMIQHEHEDHDYCGECQRTFMNQNNLRMHLNSRIHRGQQVQCPFCRTAFTTATGLVHHVERGGCRGAAGLDRDTLYKYVRSKDPNGVITNNLIDWYGSTQYEATDSAYNYRRGGWECYLCHRLFALRTGLNQHLNSPVHQENLYHCPNRGCGKEFTTLAAIINHLESESCGFTRFNNVQRGINDMISGGRLIAF
ncbi:hypothetical protein C8A05DRAFT_39760 [Staphylotrichum tortipilum]|uniref:C2H2-type domain-containing protein n=1 Tax=Staphylotrichum tortipilum TaxID=2831512 RepID=A0AAN6M8G8_9PEZI|nr:hypothetical protein C8A05DRAFT_39760 [Staphylotrichum longicolle]